jgi:hypothetical protein
MRIAIPALIALLLAGCGDPATDPLSAGATALLSDPGGTPLDLLVSVQGETGDRTVMQPVPVPANTRVTVLDDDQGSPSHPERRIVEVRVGEGEHRGLVGYVARYKLRPVAQ